MALLALMPWMSQAAQAPGSVPEAPASAASSALASQPPLPAPHPHTQHLPAQIRQVHLNRLTEGLSSTPEALHQQCRYESDIATPPPAGLVALTFDDGPDPEHTEQILAVLARYDVPATFFFIGERMQQHPDLVAKALAGNRHLIASHSWSHPNFHDLDQPTQWREIERGLAQMPPSAGLKIYRYPFGNATCYGNELLHAQGWRIVGWHVDSCDWAFDRTGSVALHEAVSCGVAPANRGNFVAHVAAAVHERHGGIVLMHEIHANTLAHLAEVIEALRQDGQVFTRLDDPRFAASLR